MNCRLKSGIEKKARDIKSRATRNIKIYEPKLTQNNKINMCAKVITLFRIFKSLY